MVRANSSPDDGSDDMQSTIEDRFQQITTRIEMAALRAGRSADAVRLVAVTKTHPADLVRTAVAAGVAIVGENYIQEARTKFSALIDQPLSWHFIGHLQRNKAKYAVRMFDLIHTVDSIKLAEELDRQAQKAGKVQNVLIQVNLGGEAAKSGVSGKGAAALVSGIQELAHIRIRGLMTLPPFFDDPERARPCFAALRRLSERIRALNLPNVEMAELSMGMTGDFETAIEEGATLVRIGTALFGGRR